MKTAMVLLFTAILSFSFKMAVGQDPDNPTAVVSDSSFKSQCLGSLRVYPNPFSTELAVSFAEKFCGEVKVKMEIYNPITNQLVARRIFINESVMSTEKLPKGSMYILYLEVYQGEKIRGAQRYKIFSL